LNGLGLIQSLKIALQFFQITHFGALDHNHCRTAAKLFQIRPIPVPQALFAQRKRINGVRWIAQVITQLGGKIVFVCAQRKRFLSRGCRQRGFLDIDPLRQLSPSAKPEKFHRYEFRVPQNDHHRAHARRHPGCPSPAARFF
jgi:hypothetical protein